MTREEFKNATRFNFKGEVYEHHHDSELVIKQPFERFLVSYDTLGFTLNKFIGKIHLKSDFIFYSECEYVKTELINEDLI